MCVCVWGGEDGGAVCCRGVRGVHVEERVLVDADCEQTVQKKRRNLERNLLHHIRDESSMYQ